MMEVTRSTSSVCEDIGCESNLPSFNCKESNAEDQQYACINNIKDTVAVEIQEVCNYCSENKESSIDEVVGLPANGVHLQDSHAQFSEFDATSDEDDLTNSVEISNYMESGLFVSFDGGVGLSKSAIFPSSELEFSHSLCVEETAASPTYKHSVSLPSSSNLVSAMKGGREQNGMALPPGLRVKWALDVYDPPPASCKLQTTTQSNNHQRLKSKRKDKHRQKHPKAKASRFSKGKNKQAKEHS